MKKFDGTNFLVLWERKSLAGEEYQKGEFNRAFLEYLESKNYHELAEELKQKFIFIKKNKTPKNELSHTHYSYLVDKKDLYKPKQND